MYMYIYIFIHILLYIYVYTCILVGDTLLLYQVNHVHAKF